MNATSKASRVSSVRKPPAGRQRICSEQQVKLIDPIWVVGPVRRRGFWDDAENCRNYLFWLAHKLHFQHMQDWYESTDAQFYENRGESLLKRHAWTRVEVVKAYFPQYNGTSGSSVRRQSDFGTSRRTAGGTTPGWARNSVIGSRPTGGG